uniref:Glycosyl transferase family 25 domain-containing protein n=1 Tax=viral metagenome TaxID=1070528 RepID=A0A6C0D6N3_9ZZZZ
MECYSICLPERIEYVKILEKKIKNPIYIFNAIDGKKHIDEFKDFKHVLPSETISAGMIGCLLSHIEVLKNAKTNILIFEDDCEYVSDCSEFIKENCIFDILLLGTNENVDFTLQNSKFVKVKRFWGTHALYVKYSTIEGILKIYEKYKSRKIFLPADWLYSYAIKEHNLRAFAPLNPKQYFKQKSGLVSSINGKVRN